MLRASLGVPSADVGTRGARAAEKLDGSALLVGDEEQHKLGFHYLRHDVPVLLPPPRIDQGQHLPGEPGQVVDPAAAQAGGQEEDAARAGAREISVAGASWCWETSLRRLDAKAKVTIRCDGHRMPYQELAMYGRYGKLFIW